ncbi:MAG: sigma-70 family RNA polymerase sigma factor [Verrucomicrobiae bacterium]|nr:sigma-70 family RNA polymerase sigma factor [Verrucomicrobiae bacterium]
MDDHGQFEAFMRDYQDMVYTTALRLVGNEADAQDIAQETFLKAYEHFDELRSSSAAGGWLKTVARNLSINHLTRYRARWHLFSDSLHDNAEDTELTVDVPARETVQSDLNLTDTRTMIEKAIASLPPAQRVALVLFHFENLGYEEIARSLKVSLGKVKTDIHRARATLKRKLAHLIETPDL